MDSKIKKTFSRVIVSLTLALTLAVIFYVLPLKGEMCSTTISAVDGENFTALQKRAFSGFRSTCRRESPLQTTTFEGTPPCAQNTFLLKGLMELHLPMTSPIKLGVTFDNYADVYFSPDGPGANGSLYYMELDFTWARIYKLDSHSKSDKQSQFKDGVEYIRVPLMITYDNGRFEVAVQGVQDSNLTYDVTSPPQPSWFVNIYTWEVVELIFTEPCINDFNPQFKP